MIDHLASLASPLLAVAAAILLNSTQLLIALVTAGLSILGAYWLYLRKREHQLVLERYLDQGIDQVIKSFQKGMLIHDHNWMHARLVIQQHRLTQKVPDHDCLQGFKDVDLAAMSISPVYRVNRLLGTSIVWNLIQQQSGQIFNGAFDLRFRVVHAFLDRTRSDHTPIAKDEYDHYNALICQVRRKGDGFTKVIGVLTELTTIFEQESFAFKTLDRFKERGDVRAIVAQLTSLKKEIDVALE